MRDDPHQLTRDEMDALWYLVACYTDPAAPRSLGKAKLAVAALRKLDAAIPPTTPTDER